MKSIDSKEELDDIMNGDRPAVIDFWASWCGPCKAMEPHYEAVANEYADDAIDFYKLNTEHNPQLAGLFNVRSIPTVIFVLEGNVVDHSVGALDAQRLAKKVELLLSKSRGENFFDRLIGRKKTDA